MSKYYAGCDVGSTYGKCVIIDETGKICGHSTVRSKMNPVATANACIEEAMSMIPDLKLRHE